MVLPTVSQFIELQLNDDPEAPTKLMYEQSAVSNKTSTSISTASRQRMMFAESSLSLRCTFTIPDGLLRAVDLREALSGFGRHWKSIDASERDFQLSSTVIQIDWFVSHAWSTPRIQKTLTLLYYSNIRAAITSAILTTVAFQLASHGLAGDFGRLGGRREYDQVYSAVVCMPSFILTFFLWHRLRPFIRRPTMIFLDKLCINQVDEEKKAAGILGLAGFLQVADTVVVLWTPEYFSRLWCAYELAAWERLGRDFRRTVKFVPVFGSCAKLACIFWSLLRCVDDLVSNDTVPQMIGGCLVEFVITHLVRAVFYEFRSIQTQSQGEGYCFRSAQCYCCSVNHQHPTTGQRLPCDRRLVMRTVRSWYNTCDGAGAIEDSDVLRQYSKRVQDDVAKSHECLVADFCSYGSVMTFDLPVLCSYIGNAVAMLLPAYPPYHLVSNTDRELAIRKAIACLNSAFFTRALARVVLFKVADRLPLLWNDAFSLRELCLTLIMSMAFSVCYFGIHFVQKSLIRESSLPVLVFWVCGKILLTLLVFRGHSAAHKVRQCFRI
eukprot:TRINITY_DN27927_c0_g1_i1.p1 TRINITY_DN27927_c0_g1~~TRINITY_DN27927_c0_g1_i1.p1  ORF type:complete len:604 (-),score=36.70 TRINITY_DN27927_c0_g1_i1:199-1848(-)